MVTSALPASSVRVTESVSPGVSAPIGEARQAVASGDAFQRGGRTLRVADQTTAGSRGMTDPVRIFDQDLTRAQINALRSKKG